MNATSQWCRRRSRMAVAVAASGRKFVDCPLRASSKATTRLRLS